MKFLKFLGIKYNNLDKDFSNEEVYTEEKTKKNEYISIGDINPCLEEKSSDMKIKVFSLQRHENISEILDRIRDRKTVCLINISMLRDKDPEELRRAIHKLKKTSSAVSGDVVSFSHDWVLVVPNNVEIERRAERTSQL